MNNQPTHVAYQVRSIEREGSEETRNFWTKIGVAWAHRKGDGLTVMLEALPLSGRLVILKRDEREGGEKDAPVEREVENG